MPVGALNVGKYSLDKTGFAASQCIIGIPALSISDWNFASSKPNRWMPKRPGAKHRICFGPHKNLFLAALKAFARACGAEHPSPPLTLSQERDEEFEMEAITKR